MLTGRDKGRTGEVIEVRPDEDRALVRGVNMVKRHQKQTGAQEGGIISKEAPIHLSNLALADPKDGKPTRVGFKFVAKGATARRCASPSARESRSMADKDEKAPKAERAPKGGKPEQGGKATRASRRSRPKGGKAPTRARRSRTAARSPKPKRPEQRVTPRLRTHFDEVVRKKLTEQFGYKNPMQVPVLEKVVINMGIGEGVNDRKKVENAAADLALIAGQKAGDHQGAQVDRHLQAARRPGDRLQGHAAQDAHVRVRRPADQHRAAARARLPRPQPEELRRPRQLRASASRSTSCSRRSTTTRRPISGAWTSWSAPARKTDDEARALLTAFNFPFRQ